MSWAVCASEAAQNGEQGGCDFYGPRHSPSDGLDSDGRALLAETSRLFECVGYLKDAEVCFIAADDLDSDR